jgi:hypothetical protein
MAYVMRYLNIPRPRCCLVQILALVLVITACTNEQARENNRLRESIIAVHDEAMEKIGYMYELELKLQMVANADPLQQQSIGKVIASLQLANKKMFDWMHLYQTLAVNKDIAKDNSYRRQQLHLIQEVQRLTDTSIEMALNILNDNQ